MKQCLFENISFQVRAGEVVTLMGPERAVEKSDAAQCYSRATSVPVFFCSGDGWTLKWP